VISAIALAGLLTVTPLPEYHLANYTCADALESVGVLQTPDGPQIVLGWRLGYEPCEDAIRRILPLVSKGEHCMGFAFIDGGRVVFCAPDLAV